MKAPGYAAIAAAAAVTGTAAASWGLFAFAEGRRKERSPKEKKEKKSGVPGLEAYSDELKAQIAAEKEWFGAQPKRDVTIVSHDGLTLRAYLLERQEAKGVVLLMHGYRSTGFRDFALAIRFYHERGYHVLLPDQRACGRSEGKYITFGVKERFDCLGWIRKAEELFPGLPIWLVGISMGAATVLMASGLELGERVRGVIADCGYTSPWEEVNYVAKRFFRIGPFPLVYGANLWSRALAGVDLREYTTLKALETNRLPVLFVHGDADELVPCRMTASNYAACTAKKELLITRGAGHGFSYVRDREEYERLVEKFLEETA